MKINMPNNYKNYFTVTEAAQAKQLIKLVKQDTMTLRELAEMAANEVVKHGDTPAAWIFRILDVQAEIVKNDRLKYDFFGDNTGIMDVSLDITAETGHGYLRIFSACLSDIYRIDNEQDFAQFMSYQYYCAYRES